MPARHETGAPSHPALLLHVARPAFASWRNAAGQLSWSSLPMHSTCSARLHRSGTGDREREGSSGGWSAPCPRTRRLRRRLRRRRRRRHRRRPRRPRPPCRRAPPRRPDSHPAAGPAPPRSGRASFPGGPLQRPGQATNAGMGLCLDGRCRQSTHLHPEKVKPKSNPAKGTSATSQPGTAQWGAEDAMETPALPPFFRSSCASWHGGARGLSGSMPRVRRLARGRLRPRPASSGPAAAGRPWWLSGTAAPCSAPPAPRPLQPHPHQPGIEADP